jgi:hypothetical protein
MGGGTQVSTSTTEPWKEQKGYLTGGFEKAKQIYDQGAPDYYPNETLAGFDPAQTYSQAQIMDYASGPRVAGMQAGTEGALMGTLAGGQTAQNYGASMASPLSQGQYSGLTPYSKGQYGDLLAGNVRRGEGTPFGAMENALTQGVTSNLQQNILPGLRQQQVMYQPGGSSRAGLEQNKAVTKAVQSGLTKPLADMYSKAYQTAQGMRMPAAQMGTGQQQYGMGYGMQGIGAQQGSMQQYPSIMNAPMSMYGAMGKVGADRRAMTQSTIDRDMARYEYDANKDQNALRNYMAMVTGDYGSTTTQTTPGPSGLSQMGQMAGIASTLFGMSDIRLKDNVTHIGIDRGYNIYSWDWNEKALELGVDTPTYGVMAQEVLETNPDAVELMDNGYYAVNYGEL